MEVKTLELGAKVTMAVTYRGNRNPSPHKGLVIDRAAGGKYWVAGFPKIEFDAATGRETNSPTPDCWADITAE